MAEVSSASVAVANAITGVFSSVGESSLRRLVSGVDASMHNLIEGIVTPTTRKVVETRGYKYRNNDAPGISPVLTPQQLQVAKTSLDPRLMKVQRDAVGLLNTVCQTSDAIARLHPDFQDVGAAHLRLTIPVPTNLSIGGFESRSADSTSLPGHSGDPTDSGNTATKGKGRGVVTGAKLRDKAEKDAALLRAILAERGGLRRTDSQFVSDDEASSDEVSSSSGGGSPVSSDGQSSFAEVPVGMLGNALRARGDIERASGMTSCPTVNLECSFCQWIDTGRAKGFLTKMIDVANPCGAKDLYVLDVVVPTVVLTTCMEVKDSLAGEDKPAKNLHIQKAQRKLRKAVSDNVSQDKYNYVMSVTNLVVSAMLLDAGDSGKNHCDIRGYSGDQPMFKDFFASQHLESAVEELREAKDEAGHLHEVMVYAVPAPQIQGTLNETLVLYETAELGDYELKEKKMVVGAVHTGVDLLGKPSPNDHTNPLNFIGAVYRHFGDSHTAVAEGTPDEYVIHLDRSERSTLTDSQLKVWTDLIEDDRRNFGDLLTSAEQKFDYDFFEDGKPNSYSTEEYERWLSEQMADEAFYAADNALCELLAHTKATSKHIQELRASAACKKGEDSARARAVITPGVAGNEGLHQARTSPIVKALEALHAVLYNHSNLKGLTEDTKRIRFAEFLRAVPKGAVVFGTDKSKNDSCFRDSVWKQCVKYLAVMNDMFEEKITTRGYVYSPDEHLTANAFPKGKLDLKYWTLKLTPLLAILLSGIGPTSFLNRLESTVDNGVSVLEIYGEEAYEKWRSARCNAQPSDHPEWRKHPLPHVAEVVEWAPLKPHMVDDPSVRSDQMTPEGIHSYHMGINEGDDQLHAFILPQSDDWAPLSTKEAVVKYSAVMSAKTGFIFEPALTSDDFDMVGHNAVCEMLSAWIGLPSGKTDNYEVAVVVPKVLKAIRKLPHCTVSSQHTLIRDAEGIVTDVIRDANYWTLALTKYYALAIMNKESLGIRGLFLAHGDYCYSKLESIVGANAARCRETMYGDRDPERRKLEEAASTTFQVCGELRDVAHCKVAEVHRDRVVRVCTTAWRSELPELASLPKEQVRASLFTFDTVSMMLEMTDEHVQDPMLVWQEFEDIGCLLMPLVRHATAQHKKVASMFRSEMLLADAEQTVQLARSLASVNPRGPALKDGRSDSTSAGPKGPGSGKGTPAGANGADSGKSGVGKGKGNGRPKGKGPGTKPTGKGGKSSKAGPKPSWSRSTTGDSWWRTYGR